MGSLAKHAFAATAHALPRRRAFLVGAAIIARAAPIARALDVAIVLHATDGSPD